MGFKMGSWVCDVGKSTSSTRADQNSGAQGGQFSVLHNRTNVGEVAVGRDARLVKWPKIAGSSRSSPPRIDVPSICPVWSKARPKAKGLGNVP